MISMAVEIFDSQTGNLLLITHDYESQKLTTGDVFDLVGTGVIYEIVSRRVENEIIKLQVRRQLSKKPPFKLTCVKN